ncbi:MAG TPA: VOC family protein [Gemmatimonas sp.]|nr:VOC family protein [Gemmatimonas sp.]
MSWPVDHAISVPAEPGTYGEPPSGFRLPASTRLGAVHLQISSLARSLAYYEAVVGLRLVERGEAHATLAAQGGTAPLVVLHELPGARAMMSRGRLGLYHFALLLPERAALGRFIRHLAARRERAGSADHLVSEALYLQDPDGLGIEVYADRPRDTWKRAGRELMMASDPIDAASLVTEAGDAPWVGLPSGTRIGHLHLHVGDLDTASRFFSDALGFDRMVWQYPGALFLGAGGYHHHLGTNTWAGTSAVPPTGEDARLREWTIELSDDAEVQLATASLQAGGFDPVHADGQTLVRDPWGTAVRIRTSADPLRRAVPRAATS